MTNHNSRDEFADQCSLRHPRALATQYPPRFAAPKKLCPPLARVFRLRKRKTFLTVTDVRPRLNSKLRKQESYDAIFQEAARLSVGEIEGHFGRHAD